ncbi:major facilitator superfamily transporter [Mytilinidion resinicola]|uniref:Major facilitator superfamily transporter n=1 Tax=Mytilinidion resinicola TaxID=574789 RepID=A0A6A6Y910_9PEZI|nr:major facilitator superfamily transporter [Mytilinidion resinicola]KAF2805302.1 major facilitator superfamily transporter [Mytilinidion resinicola]
MPRDSIAGGASERSPLLVHQQFSSPESSQSASASSTSSSESGDNKSIRSFSKPPTDEESRAANGTIDSQLQQASTAAVARIIVVLLIGVFISNADGSLVLATHPLIASEFNDLSASSWLFTSFALAGAATQSLYGKLSDIYGRKALVLVAYGLFAFGLVVVGLGTSMWQVILGRVISGAGGAGMTVLVSILITDLVPLRQVASWRSYVNVVATTGRSIGGPLGGWLADTIGWRWSFFGQAPLIVLAMILCWVVLPSHNPKRDPKEPLNSAKGGSRFARIDFLGAALMAAMILSFLLPIEIGGVKVPWKHPLIPGLFGLGIVLAVLFVMTEAWWAKEPVLPLQLLRQRDAVASYLIMAFQTAAQLGMMFSVPLYFQITSKASNTMAGAHLAPAVVGNALGGIASGLLIRRFGRYKAIVVLAAVFSSLSYSLLIVRWRGHTNWWESLYIIPGGFGQGLAQSALFISLQAAIDPAHTAVATSALYLTGTIGMIMGLAGVSATMQETLRRGLDRRLLSLGFGHIKRGKIIHKAVSDIGYVQNATGAVGEAVLGAYIEGIEYTHVVSLGCSLLAFVGSLVLQEHKL